jgi:PTH1 family peptidyl-tRNA hydrolase
MAATDPTRLFVGLGNPGPRYAVTRHNAGFWVLDRLAHRRGAVFAYDPVDAEVALLQVEGPGGPASAQTVALVKPLSFMNRSGLPVEALCNRFGLGPEDMLVVVDDMHLERGRLRLRAGGSSGGHNGLGSIAETMGTEAFARLRFGIGEPPPEVDPVEYVLGRITPEEEEIYSEAMERAAECLLDWVACGTEYCQETYNKRPE